jgi:enoyl-CoA hydratase
MRALIVERADTVETWTMNRPRVRNALDEALVSALRDALATAEAVGTEVVVLRGAGPSFCAGADLALLAGYDARRGATPRDHLRTIWDLTLAMERSPMVFVAVLHGHAVAGGFELALACDVVIASEDTLIGDGHVRHCLLPAGGASARMERALGRGASSWLALTGDRMAAGDPVFGAWLRAVPPPEELDAAVAEALEKLTAVPAVARAAYKSVLRDAHGPLTEVDRDTELDAFDRHWLANDVPAVLRTFLAKNRKVS